MTWRVRETYDDLVCFATLMLTVLGLMPGVLAALARWQAESRG
jgi:hypothetical protein